VVWEDGVNWLPQDPDKRGRHATFGAALDAGLKDLLVERNSFFDTLADEWAKLFPDLPIRPGRYEDGFIFLYVRNAPTRFLMQGKLPHIRRRLAALPGAPKKLNLRLEIRTT